MDNKINSNENLGAPEKTGILKGILEEASRRAKKIGLVLCVAGTVLATDTNAQQGQNTTTGEVPTPEEIIGIISKGKGLIQTKFNRSFNDTIFKQIVASIALGEVKPETLMALGGAFPAGSEEQIAIFSFATVKKQEITKPIATKTTLPPLTETKDQKMARLEKERLEKLAGELVKEFNKNIKNADKWSSLKIGGAGVDAVVEIKKSNGGLKFSIGKDKAFGQAVLHADLLAGKYNVELTTTAGEIIIWWKDGKTITLSNGLNTFELPQATKIDICVKPNKVNSSIEVDKLVISQEKDAEIVVK